MPGSTCPSFPALPGAVELLGQAAFAARSTPRTRKRRKGHSSSSPSATRHPKVELLFDPQTSGGLLFGLPEAKVAAALSELQATVIGEVVENRPDEASIEVVAS